MSLIYRKVVRQIFHIYIGLSGKKHIVAKIEHPSLANYLYGIIGIAWLCDKMTLSLEFVFPNEAPSFFENSVLHGEYPNKTIQSKSFLISDSRDYLASIARKAARKDISGDFGNKVISKLSIRQAMQSQADEWFASHIKSDWIAVHYRGTDAHTHSRSEKRRISIALYIAWLQEVLDSRCSIFACSDQAQFIDEMQQAFPKRIYYRDIRRSADSQPLHLSDNRQQKRDALIDVLILARASLVYTTGSWFVDVVKNFNPKIKIISLDRRIERRSAQNYLPIPKESLLQTLYAKEN